MNIRKAKQVIGQTLTFRNATKEDAEFILGLRTDPVKSRFLTTTSAALADQTAWLESYENKSGQVYFIIEYEGKKIGTVRLYDQQANSFCWGSWILIDDRPSHAAMESALMVYSYAIDNLGFTAAHFDVRKGNEKVWKFHERFGAERVSESDLDYFYSLSLEAIKESLVKYSRFLSGSVKVNW